MRYDIIIVGGGITGLTLACMLAQQTSLSILVLEAQNHFDNWSPKYDYARVSAISLSSRHIFKSLQLWDELQHHRVSPFSQIEVWDALHKGQIIFDSQEINQSLLGYIIENNLIQTVLTEKIKSYPHVHFITGVQLKTLRRMDHYVELLSDNNDSYQGKLIIAADGAKSWIRQQAGIDIKHASYQQHAIVTTVQTELPHDRRARQVFLRTGPLAFLPLLDEKKSSIVWSLPTEEAKQWMAVDESLFQQKLSEALEYRLGQIIKTDQRYAFPLFKQCANHYLASGVVLIGDAAHTVHPLAGQGVNMGLLDVASLVDVIVQAIKQGRDWSSHATLRRYERWRKADNLALFAGIDALQALFASENKTLQILRSTGLQAIHHLKWIKNQFAYHAVGRR